ncbi:hypothetical protein HpM067_11830 [Helicobacter pylori]
MNQNTEQVSQNKGLNEFERAKIYYTKKVADNLLFIANPGNKAETPYKSGAKLEKMGLFSCMVLFRSQMRLKGFL